MNCTFWYLEMTVILFDSEIARKTEAFSESTVIRRMDSLHPVCAFDATMDRFVSSDIRQVEAVGKAGSTAERV
jgi:hypothetical protein